ncbi:MAG: Uma2 family endonuclease [Pyrinomonadaceae bacterium]|nr:Uma2 family endonuclease [Pyrinomonadaceae bacterium]
MTVTTQLMTAEDLLKLPQDGFRYELVEGELKRMPPAGHEHGDVTMNIAAPLHRHVKSNGLGKVYAAETGFLLQSNPDTIRAPDAAFVRRERVEQVGKARSYWPGAPDLVVEVISPGDPVSQVEEKVQEWLKFGVRLVWVVSPKLRTVTAYRSLTDVVVLTEKDTLDSGDVVPGFQISVAEIFGG